MWIKVNGHVVKCLQFYAVSLSDIPAVHIWFSFCYG